MQKHSIVADHAPTKHRGKIMPPIAANRDVHKEFSQEYLEKWCKENDLPVNFFDLPVQERRDAIMDSHRRLWPIDPDDYLRIK
jgi:hypothetical protein